jgi:beta-mannosidase
LDLMRAGVIGDPFYRMQERACRWVDEADWTYRTTFAVDAERLASRGRHGRHFLVFHRLDTLARVFLNSTLVGEPKTLSWRIASM